MCFYHRVCMRIFINICISCHFPLLHLLRLLFLRDGIIPPGVPRMTARDALSPEPTAPQHAIAFYGDVSITAARRIKTTKTLSENLAQKPVLEREGFLIQSYEQQYGPLEHFQSITGLKPMGKSRRIALSIRYFIDILEKNKCTSSNTKK